MKKSVLLCSLGALAAFAAQAQEVGRVISSTPVIQQVAVPRQVCNQQPVAVQQPSSGVGSLVGAVAGGLLGNTVGGGSGRVAATAIGVIGGAMVGDRVEANGQPPMVQNVQNCVTQTFYENRTVAYNVAYEYNGRQYNVQMPQDPGPTVRLQVTPVGAAPQPGDVPGGQTYSTAPDAQQGIPILGTSVTTVPAPVVYPAAAYPAYPYPAQYYGYRPWPPVGVMLNFGYSHGRWH